MTSMPSNMRSKEEARIDEKRKMQEAKIATWVNYKFKEAWAAKQPFEQLWKKLELAYNGKEYVGGTKPSYKSDHVSNYIYKTVETIRPIMIDRTPKFQVLPKTKAGKKSANKVQVALQYEYDRENMQVKIGSNLIDFLTKGNMVFYVPWDGEDGGMGNTKIIPVNLFAFFPDPNATCMSDAQHVIYATYMSENELRKRYPDKKGIKGSSVMYQDIMGNREHGGSNTERGRQILVLKMFLRDTSVTMEEEWIDRDEGLKKQTYKPKYPNGREIVCAPDLGLVFEDRQIPYEDGNLPFVHIKDINVPFEFWGKSTIEQLMSPQKYMNDITNQIIDNARHTANPIWKITNNAGIAKGKLNNRPGLIVRYNQGAEVSRETPPGMPAYVFNTLENLKNDVEVISGVHESLAGERPVGIQNASAINSLQEAGQARIRMKTRSLEEGLSLVAQMVFSRMQQFWNIDRFVRVIDEEGATEFKEIKTEDLVEPMDIRVFAGSTMPESKDQKMQQLIQLAQTPMEDGLPVVDRETIMTYLDVPDKKGLIERMKKKAEEIPNEVDALKQEIDVKFQEFGGIVQELSKAVQQINQQMNRLQSDHERIMQEEKDAQNVEKGYNQGLGQIPPDLQADEQAALQAQRDASFTNQINSGIIPEEVVDELLNMDDRELRQLLQQNPQLLELIQSNLQ